MPEFWLSGFEVYADFGLRHLGSEFRSCLGVGMVAEGLGSEALVLRLGAV